MNLSAKIRQISVISVLLFFYFNFLFAQKNISPEEMTTRLLFILDGSQSMSQSWGNDTKVNVAKNTLTAIIDTLKNTKNLLIGLRVYGHQLTDDCKDTKLEVGFEYANVAAPLIQNKLKEIRPRGKTPIGYSLEQSAYNFPSNLKSRNIIILITDGIETCGADPCAISLALQKQGVFLRPFVIGLNLYEDARSQFECTGAYFNAKDVSSFEKILQAVVSRSVNYTTTQVSLLDKFDKPTETDANMTFYDDFSGVIRYNYYHTMNFRGNPDTLFIDPVNTYNLTVHTLPPLQKEDIDLIPHTHNTISFNAPQGYLKLVLQGITVNENINNKIKCLIRDNEEDKTLNVQNMNVSEKYLTGKYDLDLLTLPRKQLKNVDIAQSNTTTLQFEAPGLVTFIKNYMGYGGIFIEKNNKLEKIYSLNESSTKETVALQPGTYRVIFRPKVMKKMSATIEQQFQITSGTSTSIKL